VGIYLAIVYKSIGKDSGRAGMTAEKMPGFSVLNIPFETFRYEQSPQR
jgi:hypothetical protein